MMIDLESSLTTWATRDEAGSLWPDPGGRAKGQGRRFRRPCFLWLALWQFGSTNPV